MARVPDPTDLPPPADLPAVTGLPDPFETFDGEPVRTVDAWRGRRRREVERLFRHYVYGYAPDAPGVDADVDRTDGVLDGRATLTRATLRIPNLPEDAPAIDLVLFTPVDSNAVPVFLGLNGTGNPTLDESVLTGPDGRRFGSDADGMRDRFRYLVRALERGYGFATFHQADVAPDRNDRADGIYAYYDRTDLPGPPGTEWGTLAAWAWGLQRAVDYLRTDALVCTDGIGVVGHSRRGKAALIAGATDERIAAVVPHQSGTGGCAVTRGTDAEGIAEITEKFPHWFNDVFPAFAGRAERLPVDQHLLVALVAPRPLLSTVGVRDELAPPDDQLAALRGAAPVYELYDDDGVADDLVLGEDEFVGSLHQYRAETGHTLDREYWEAVLDFADHQFERGRRGSE